MSQANLPASGVSRVNHTLQHVAPVEVGGVTHAPGQPQGPRALEAANLQTQAQVVPAEAPPRVLHRSWPDRGVLVEATDDGLDYWRSCDRHQWADGPFHALPVPPCVLCTADIRPGQRKYWALHQAGVRIVHESDGASVSTAAPRKEPRESFSEPKELR